MEFECIAGWWELRKILDLFFVNVRFCTKKIINFFHSLQYAQEFLSHVRRAITRNTSQQLQPFRVDLPAAPFPVSTIRRHNAACQVRYGSIRGSSASSRPPCDDIPSAFVWPSPRHTPGPPGPYPSDMTPPDATMKRVDAPSAWSSSSDLDKKESDGRDPSIHVRARSLRLYVRCS